VPLRQRAERPGGERRHPGVGAEEGRDVYGEAQRILLGDGSGQ
jgi:hypothetical protein